jgi:hypothetical protein
MKQLVYLERYGRMYIPEESLMGDFTFVRAALSGLPPLDPALVEELLRPTPAD